MKRVLASLAVLGLPAVACAQSPDVPQPPETPDVSTITEDCGENCTRTTTTIRSAELDEDGYQTISKSVQVIELRPDADGTADINIDIENNGVARKQMKIIAATDGEIPAEIRDKINALIADADNGEGYAFAQSGDGLVVMSADSDTKTTRVIIRDGEQEILNSSGDVTVNQFENEDGSRTIRIVPEDGSGETTIITIQTENSSNSDN